MNEFIGSLNDLIWGWLLIYLLAGTGIFFTVRLGFIQFRHFFHMFAVLHKSNKSDAAGISSFQALCTSLAARVGTGNLAGVAVAIYLGGPGAVFWMWLIAVIGMSTAFAESALGQLFKVRDQDGNFRGGPAYYMENGLNKRWMGVLFAVCLLLAFGLVFNAVQASSISVAMGVAFGIPPWVTGIGLVVLAGIIISGGLRSVARFAGIVVPIMAVTYLLLALVVVFMNLSEVPRVIALIFGSAFGLEQAGSGVIGYTISQALMNGVRRGLFSNEAGMGSAPNAAATATPYPPHPAAQGYVQMLAVFVDTIVICSCTAAVVLLSGEFVPGSGITGIELTQDALSAEVGPWGNPFIAIAVFFFAFTSIVANYSYAETNLIFLKHKHKAGLNILRLVVLGMVFFGSVGELPLVWALADVSMGLMAIVNLVAILMLSGIAAKLAKDYNRQLKAGQLPVFDARLYPELLGKLEPGIWDQPQKNTLNSDKAQS